LDQKTKLKVKLVEMVVLIQETQYTQ